MPVLDVYTPGGNQLLHDIRIGLRQIKTHPGWALAIILVLAVGIGANTAMFSGFEAWVLRPLDFEAPERLVSLNESQPRLGRYRSSISPPNLGDWMARQSSYEGIAAYRGVQVNLSDEAEPARLVGARIAATLFPLLGKTPVLGRNFTEGEDLPGQPAPVALISDRMWRERFESDPDIVGRTIRLDGATREIVGVMEPFFAFPAWSDVWIPLGLDVDDGARDSRWLRVVARLREGVSLEAADAELATIAESLAQQYPEANRGFSANVISLRREFVPPVIEVALTTSLAAGIFVLLVICANVASLILARAAARSRETAVRAALGASRLRLVRQSIIESLLLAIPAGLLGAGIGVVGVHWMLSYVPVDPPYLFRMGFSAEAGVYTFVVALVAGAVCGLAPVFRSSGSRLFEGLKSGGREAGGKEATRFRSGLIVCELALSTSLLIGALLMVKSFIVLQAVEPGFRSEGVMTTELSLRGVGEDASSEWVALGERLASTIESKSGVETVGLTSQLPAGQSVRTWGLVPQGRPRELGEDSQATVHAVFGDYFGAMGMPVRAGRDFTDLEKRSGGDVAIVSRGLADSLWSDVDPIGRHLRAAGDTESPWLRVVGVVGDVDVGRDMVSFGDIPDVQIYVPYGQTPTAELNVVVRGRGARSALASAMQDALRGAAPGVPFSEILTMDDAIFRVRWVSSFFSRQLILYALLATVIAGIGIYGLTADSLARRTRELAIRTALGAERGSLVRLILREATILGGIGVFLGLGLSLAVTGFASSMFTGVGARDPVIFASVAVAVFAVVVAATVPPARRASARDPISALRTE